MKRSKSITLVAMGLIAGLVLGSLSIASAAPATDPATDEPLGVGARIGWAVRDAGARMSDIVAELTGLDVADVQDRRADGESVADIAESEGVSSETVVDEALAARQAILDEKVADGTIDQATADLMLDRMTDRVTERVDSTEIGGNGYGCDGGGCGGGQGAGSGGGRGMGGQGFGGQGGAGLQDGSCLTE